MIRTGAAHLVLSVVLATNVILADEPPSPPPQWLLDHMEYMAEPGGIWITDNSEFRSEQEPADSYGTEWEWGVGKTTLRGRLFGMLDGRETAEFWQYQVFWHPGEDEASMVQFGVGGVLGIGQMWRKEDGIVRSEMTFYYPGRGSERVAHDLIESSPDAHLTRSYGWRDGEWNPRREYVWKRKIDDQDAIVGSGASGLAILERSAELEMLSFLVGEWVVDGTFRLRGETLKSHGAAELEWDLGGVWLAKRAQMKPEGHNRAVDVREYVAWNAQHDRYDWSSIDSQSSIVRRGTARFTEEGKLMMVGEPFTWSDGRTYQFRRTTFASTEGTVTELSEVSTDGGETWLVNGESTWRRRSDKH